MEKIIPDLQNIFKCITTAYFLKLHNLLSLCTLKYLRYSSEETNTLSMSQSGPHLEFFDNFFSNQEFPSCKNSLRNFQTKVSV